MKWDEGDLRFDFTSAVQARRFDDGTHGLSHCMKAVDFILETKEAYYFLEIKDPDNPAADASRRAQYVQELRAGELRKSLVGKYRDTFIYHWAEKTPGKPIYYIVLLCLTALDAAALLAQEEGLRSSLPLSGSSTWKRPIAKACLVLSLDAWNRHFKQWPVSRISASAS